MQHVEMWQAAVGRRYPMKLKASVNQRQVETLAVVRHQRAEPVHHVGNVLKKHALGGVVTEKELPDPKRGPVKPSDSNEKRVRSRATSQARRLKVEEQGPATQGTRSPAAGHQQIRAWPQSIGRRYAIRHRHATETMLGRVVPIDHQIAVSGRWPPGRASAD